MGYRICTRTSTSHTAVFRPRLPEAFRLAIPLQKGQLSCREVMNGERLVTSLQPDQPVMIDALDSPYARVQSLRQEIYKRGL